MLNRLKEKAWIISGGLILAASILWILSCLQARNDLPPRDELGLFSILPVTFFVAFGLLILSFFIVLKYVNKNQQCFLICQTLLLIFFLNLTPSIIEGTARFTTSYINYSAVDYISQTGHFDPSITYILNWPGFSILFSIFSQITAIPGQTILLIYPTFFNTFFFVPLFVFFRLIFHDSKMVWFATWFFLLANWIGQDYFSMQSLAFLGFVLILFLLFKIMNEGTLNLHWALLLYFFFFYTVSSHLLSSLAVLCVVVAFYLSKQLKRTILLVSLICLIAGWTFFNAAVFLQDNLKTILGHVLDISVILKSNLENRLASGSASRVLAANIRVGYSGIIIGLALLGVFISWREKRFERLNKKMFAFLLSSLLLAAAFSYGGEVLERVFLFSLIPLVYFAIKTFKYKPFLALLLLFLMVAAPFLNFAAHYGNERLDYVPPSEPAGVSFLYETSNGGHVIGGGFRNSDMRDFVYRGNYSFTSFANLYSSNTSSSLWNQPRDSSEDRFVCISYATEAYFSFFVGNPVLVDDLTANLTNCVSYNLIYSNPSLAVYMSKAELNTVLSSGTTVSSP